MSAKPDAKFYTYLAIFTAVAIAVAFTTRFFYNSSDITVSSFEDCVAAGNPVMESWPRQCAADGQTFVEDIGNELDKSDLIRVDVPRPNSLVTSPMEITGQAKGEWYFEGTFPIYLYDANGVELGVMGAQAQGDWMSDGFVPFSVIFRFDPPKTSTGELILQKDNPSGLPEFADELRIPVHFR